MTRFPDVPLSAWQLAMEERRDRESRRHARESVGFLVSAIIGLGLAMLAAVLSRS